MLSFHPRTVAVLCLLLATSLAAVSAATTAYAAVNSDLDPRLFRASVAAAAVQAAAAVLLFLEGLALAAVAFGGGGGPLAGLGALVRKEYEGLHQHERKMAKEK